MSGVLQPLDQKFAIVDANGRPTEFFVRWAQQRQIDIGDSITLGDLQQFLTDHPLVEGVGIQLSPSGDIGAGVTIDADVQEILDTLTSTRGALIYRGLLGWTALLPGIAGQVLSTGGAGTDPSWITPSSGGGGSWDSLGANVVIDPDFLDPTKWLTSGGWSISGGNAVGTGAADSLRQNGILTVGKAYRIAFPWTKTGGAALRLRTNAGSNLIIQNVNGSSGIFYGTFVADGTDMLVQAEAAPFTGTISQISVKEITPNY